MEDKWDMFFFDDFLYFARSWTGILQMRAQVQRSGKYVAITAVEAGPGNRPTPAPPQGVRDVDFLVKSHVFGHEVPHALPPGVPDDPQLIAPISMQMFGRWASFATFEDSTRFDPFAP